MYKVATLHVKHRSLPENTPLVEGVADHLPTLLLN